MTVLRSGELLVATHGAIDHHDTRGRFLASTPRNGASGTLIVEGDTRLLVNQSAVPDRHRPLVRTGLDHMIHSLAVVDGWRASRQR